MENIGNIPLSRFEKAFKNFILEERKRAKQHVTTAVPDAAMVAFTQVCVLCPFQSSVWNVSHACFWSAFVPFGCELFRYCFLFSFCPSSPKPPLPSSKTVYVQDNKQDPELWLLLDQESSEQKAKRLEYEGKRKMNDLLSSIKVSVEAHTHTHTHSLPRCSFH